MMFLNSNLIITDPCYLLSKSDWNKLTNHLHRDEEEFNETSSMVLNNIGIRGIIRNNRVGDGRFNIISSRGDNVGTYWVDSGLVCFIDHDSYLEYLDKLSFDEKNDITWLCGGPDEEHSMNEVWIGGLKSEGWSYISNFNGNILLGDHPFIFEMYNEKNEREFLIN